MFVITTYNHETKKDENRFEFSTKREANKFLKDNTEKRGYDFFSVEDRSLEFSKCF